MNAVEIEEAVSALAGRPFDRADFPYAFLSAFGNKETTIKRLRSGQSNGSDHPGGVLQRNNIHIAVCSDGTVSRTLVELRENPKTAAAKAKFVLATDGIALEAEEIASGDHIACAYQDFAKYFGFFLPLAGMSTISEIKNNPFDIKATGKLNKLYVELLKDNPDWATEAKRPALNQFIARLIFCFFAEDTGIFHPKQFTKILETMSDSQSGNTHEILCELFRAMDTPTQHNGAPDDRYRRAAKIKGWANFPYVNGGMFAGAAECPRFSRIARSYLLNIGSLEWDKINPDIFGSMIQAVADDKERGEIGMHYTSVPNILKVLNPLFLDDLRAQLQVGEDNPRKLRNLRKRLSSIRVFDPACGSGNFLVIAYKEMRAIEHEIVKRTKDDPKSWIKLENFYGIELKNFAVEIARLALLIAEFQSDVRYINQQEARAMVLPLHKTGQIVADNALTIDWAEVCPHPIKSVVVEHDLGGPTGKLALDDSSILGAEEIETYICGNPPYLGSKWQTEEHKADLAKVFSARSEAWKSLDYVAGWFMKAADYGARTHAAAAFVSTNSICQGQQVPYLWPLIFETGHKIFFAHTSFKWTNLASNKAGVTVVIVGLSKSPKGPRTLFELDDKGSTVARETSNIGPYLIPGSDVIVYPRQHPLSSLPTMSRGNSPTDGGNLLLDAHEIKSLGLTAAESKLFIRRFVGSQELIAGAPRYCIWIEDTQIDEAMMVKAIAARVHQVKEFRLASKKAATVCAADWPHRFDERKPIPQNPVLAVPVISSENRLYLPCDLLAPGTVVSNKAFTIPVDEHWPIAIICSRMNTVWVATVCARMRTDYSYTNTLGWNTLPIPNLTEKNKADLSECAHKIFLARDAHFPASIADLYDPESMPADLRNAHEENDEVLERVYIGRRFRNDTERLEKLFELYAKMVAEKPISNKKAKSAA